MASGQPRSRMEVLQDLRSAMDCAIPTMDSSSKARTFSRHFKTRSAILFHWTFGHYGTKWVLFYRPLPQLVEGMVSDAIQWGFESLEAYHISTKFLKTCTAIYINRLDLLPKKTLYGIRPSGLACPWGKRHSMQMMEKQVLFHFHFIRLRTATSMDSIWNRKKTGF